MKPNDIATDGQRVYITAEDGKLYVTNVDGGGVTTVGMANASGALGLALDTSSVYWAVADPTAGTINVAPKTTLATHSVASSQVQPAGVATDGVSVYWVNFGTGISPDGKVLKCSIASCPIPTALASGPADPRSIFVDDAYVYWIDYGQTLGRGTLWKVAK